MEANLSKKDIIRLVRGVEIPDFKSIFEINHMGLGHYVGGFVDSFEWNTSNDQCWDKYSEEDLFELYKKITE